MIKFLGGGNFLYVFIPLFSITLTIYVRFSTQRSEDREWRKENVAVGPELMQLGMIGLLTMVAERAVKLKTANDKLSEAIGRGLSSKTLANMIERSQSGTSRLVESMAALFALMLALWGISFAIQQWGWRGKDDLRPSMGIAIPLFFGAGSLLIAIGLGR